MADLALSVWVTRVQLGLGNLVLGPSDRYSITPQFLGTQVAWTRQQATSPFVDGQFTVGRTRQNVSEPVGVEVMADTVANLQAYITELIVAFNQDSFTLHVEIESVVYEYECEASDVQVLWTGSRFIARQGQVIFQVMRRPAAITGGY